MSGTLNRILAVGMRTVVFSGALLAYGAPPPPPPAAPNDVVGSWHYRSFLNENKQVSDLNTILFGEGDLTFEEAPPGVLTGTGDFGGGLTMKYQGSVVHAGGITVRFQGVGAGASNKDWLYDYVGVLVPQWPNGVGQVPAIVGSVVRSAPHSNGSGGTAAPGRVASFIAVKR
jgi:hypothetical protein